MDYETACRFLINQAALTGENPDTFLLRLSHGEPPIPGQVTSILLALKIVFEGLQGETSIDRSLAGALYELAMESRHYFDQGLRRGVNWPPLLDQDITRMAIAVRSIFASTWFEQTVKFLP